MTTSALATVTTIYHRCAYCTRHVFTSRMDRRTCLDCLEDPTSGATWPYDSEENKA